MDGNEIGFSVFDDFYDTDIFFGIDTLDTKITPNIFSHPKGTRKYKYYLDGILYGITESDTFSFTGLTPGKRYKVKIEALNENGNVLSSVESETETNYFSSISTEKTENTYKAILKKIDSRIKRYSYVIWSDENENDSKTFYPRQDVSSDRTISVNFDRLTFGKYTDMSYIYRIHIYLYDENDNIISTLPINILFGKTVTRTNSVDIYELKDSGNYEIIVTDFAGNKEEYDVYIRK